jgi:hypothetical protein
MKRINQNLAGERMKYDDLDTESLDPAILFLFSLVERGLSYEHYHEMREK